VLPTISGVKLRILSLAAASLSVISAATAQLTPTVTKTYIAYSEVTNLETKLDFTLGADLKTLTVLIDNNYTLPGHSTAKGRLTTLGFDIPSGLGAVTLTDNSTDTWKLANPYDPSAGGNGQHDEVIGAYVGSNLNGGTSEGVAFGETVTLTFTFANAVTLVGGESSGFFADFKESDNTYHQGIATRWQSITGNGGTTSDEGFGFPEDLPPAPEPSTYGAMSALGLGCLALVRRRNRR